MCGRAFVNCGSPFVFSASFHDGRYIIAQRVNINRWQRQIFPNPEAIPLHHRTHKTNQPPNPPTHRPLPPLLSISLTHRPTEITNKQINNNENKNKMAPTNIKHLVKFKNQTAKTDHDQHQCENRRKSIVA